MGAPHHGKWAELQRHAARRAQLAQFWRDLGWTFAGATVLAGVWALVTLPW